MGGKRLAGYVFITFKGDHRPYHVHIVKDRKEIGRWDIENQVPMDEFQVDSKLREALRKLGYMLGGE